MPDLLEEIYGSLRRNKLRTALTGFAVAWGVFMIIALLGAGNGLLNAMTDNNDDRMVNTIAVYPGNTSVSYDGLPMGRRIEMDDRDIETSESAFPDIVDEVTAAIYQRATVSFRKEYEAAILYGVYPAFCKMEKVSLLHGRFINDSDMKDFRKCIVIPASMSEQLSGRKNAPEWMLGKEVNIGGIMYKVVGITKTSKDSEQSLCFLPFHTMKKIFNKGLAIDEIHMSFHGLPDEESNEAFEKQYKRTLNANHRASPQDMETFWIWNRFTSNIQMNKAISIIQTALWIIGLFTLLAGIVGVSNIMLITVKERTREFSIRKAIGASPASILRLIVAESITITGIFGYIGMIAGLLSCEVMNLTLAQKTMSFAEQEMKIFKDPFVGVDVALEATLVLIIAGLIAGIIPAWRASRVRPIEALKEGTK
jgi:ABC-type antimicrobial peptide transport system, permease component